MFLNYFLNLDTVHRSTAEILRFVVAAARSQTAGISEKSQKVKKVQALEICFFETIIFFVLEKLSFFTREMGFGSSGRTPVCDCDIAAAAATSGQIPGVRKIQKSQKQLEKIKTETSLYMPENVKILFKGLTP